MSGLSGIFKFLSTQWWGFVAILSEVKSGTNWVWGGHTMRRAFLMWWLKYETCDIMVTLYPCTPCILIITPTQPQQDYKALKINGWKLFIIMHLILPNVYFWLLPKDEWPLVQRAGARPGQLFIVRLNCVDNKLLPNIIYHTNSILPPNSTHLKCMQWHWQYSSFSIFVLLLTNIFLLIILGRHKNRQTRV